MMRIVDNNTPATTTVGQTNRPAETQAAGATAKGGSTTSSSAADGLQLSSFTGAVNRAIQSDSASRAQRVTELSAAYKSGSYHVDSAAVSRAIVDYAISAGQDAQ